VDEFLGLVSKSGLLDPQQIQTYLQCRRADCGTPRTLANAMVCDGVLTRFQAEQVLRGKWRNFILSGKYKILGPLASGGMGHVFLCEHQIMRRRVAVKVLPRSSDLVSLERFRREARAVAQLKHTNIVGGHDIDQDGKVHFLVMEYIDGSTFQTIVKKRGAIDPVRAAHYIRQASLGLQHAHEAGLVHRDIKPSNLVLDRRGTVKILDLGLARFFHDESDDLSRPQTDSPMGTMDYMAPEQAINSHQVDIRADIYSLGATFYFLLAGHGPFRDGTAIQKMISHQFERPKPIREIRPDVPAELVIVIDRMMAKDVAGRYQTPAEISEALVPWTRAPIPPPPLEEMPELIAPSLNAIGGSPADLPASLYEPGPEGDAFRATGTQPPQGAPRTETLATGTLEGSLETPQPGPSPPAPRNGVKGLARPATLPSKGSDMPRLVFSLAFFRAKASPVISVVGVLLLGAVVVAFAALLRNGDKGSLPTTSRPEDPAPAGADTPPRLRLLVPAYFYPAGEGLKHWDRLLEAPDPTSVVVIANPDSGPGKVTDPNFVRVIERARQKGFMVIGYVSTVYAKRPIEEVKADIDRWVLFYPGVRGMFFDEQASAAEPISYYEAVYRHARKERRLDLVINNPGTICAEEYLARPAADVECLVESGKEFGSYHPPPWATGYPALRFAGTLFGNDDVTKMKQYVLEMVAKRVGYCYITDGKEPNPWNRLPRYWEAEVEVVQQVNRER
jgi:serine/threonine protein kinase